MNVRGSRALALTFLAALLAIAPSVRAQTSEDVVKATFFYRFASFVEWPAGAFTDPAAPIRLCVIGSEPFARTLRRAINGQRINGRSFDVRELSGAADARQCHAVYVVGERTDAALRAAHGQGVLTVTDGAWGGNDRGIIHFVVVEDRVRFHIDHAEAGENQLHIDPRLLNLALSVRRGPSS
jgi:hypothetical protein